MPAAASASWVQRAEPKRRSGPADSIEVALAER